MSLADFEECQMPNGAVCWYCDCRHAYYRSVAPVRKGDPDGDWKGVGRLTGVSTVVGPADFNPGRLLAWAARTDVEGVAELFRRSVEAAEAEEEALDVSWLGSRESIQRELRRYGLTYGDVRDQAADRGTNTHMHALHALAAGKRVPDYHALSEEEQGYAQGVVAFWLDHDPEPLQAEQVVMDAGLGVAGRFDLRCEIGRRCGRPGCPCAGVRRVVGEIEAYAGGEVDPSVVLLDCKTSGFIALKMHVQLAGYEHCARVSGFGFSEAQWILQVDEGGGYALIPSCAATGDFVAVADVYRRAAVINKLAEKDRKEREAA